MRRRATSPATYPTSASERRDLEANPGEAVLVGTAAYMAPEQAQGKNELLDERTDVFAVGALVYHVLTRRPPYSGEHF